MRLSGACALAWGAAACAAGPAPAPEGAVPEPSVAVREERAPLPAAPVVRVPTSFVRPMPGCTQVAVRLSVVRKDREVALKNGWVLADLPESRYWDDIDDNHEAFVALPAVGKVSIEGVAVDFRGQVYRRRSNGPFSPLPGACRIGLQLRPN